MSSEWQGQKTDGMGLRVKERLGKAWMRREKGRERLVICM